MTLVLVVSTYFYDGGVRDVWHPIFTTGVHGMCGRPTFSLLLRLGCAGCVGVLLLAHLYDWGYSGYVDAPCAYIDASVSEYVCVSVLDESPPPFTHSGEYEG